MRALGQHTLLDFYGCDPSRLKRAARVKEFLVRSVLAGGGKIVKAVFHNFNPYGVSGVVVITESHVTIHTWPEHGYAAVDIFSCSARLHHSAISRELKSALGARRVLTNSFGRGRAPGSAKGKDGQAAASASVELRIWRAAQSR